LTPGCVEVCCTKDQDVHKVARASHEPCVGLHVYGRDIGRLERHTYDEYTGQTEKLVSAWASA
jgi:predicted metal-dependent enzyme (double-stranded beta helix superfamily)